MSDPLAKCLLSVPTTSCSGSPEVLVPEGRMLPTGDIVLSLNWKLRLATLGSCTFESTKSSNVGWGP